MPRPDPETVAEAVFAALAEPTRRSVLGALAARGPTAATGLAGLLPILRQAITKHLELLAASRLVLAEPGDRRRVRYRVDAAPMAIAQSCLAALARDWDSKLAPAAALAGRPGSRPEAAPDPEVPGDDLTWLGSHMTGDGRAVHCGGCPHVLVKSAGVIAGTLVLRRG